MGTTTVSQRTTRRRTIGALLGALFLSLAALVVVLSAVAPAEAKPKFKTVTQTISTPQAVVIGTGSLGDGVAAPYPSGPLAPVGLKKGKIVDVNLALKDYRHGSSDHVSVLVEGPGGRDAVVMADVGGTDEVLGVDLVLDDEAPGFLPDNSQITGGRFRPTRGTSPPPSGLPSPSVYPGPARDKPYASSLRVFDGAGSRGSWKLFVYDDTPASTGTFNGGWGVTVKAKVRR